MEIRSLDGELGVVQISGWSPESLDICPSFECTVRMAVQGFRGENGVYFSKADLEIFRHALVTLDKTRRGTATLRSMSPQEFCLALEAYDRLGHVQAVVAIRKFGQYGRDCIVQAGFEIEPTLLSDLAQQFADQMARLG